jgi:hypothetical protein
VDAEPPCTYAVIAATRHLHLREWTAEILYSLLFALSSSVRDGKQSVIFNGEKTKPMDIC